MATYPPPNYTEPLPVFNPINWEPQNTGNTTIDINYANANYLKYPVAQGTETTQDIIVNGTAQFNDDMTIGSGSTANNTPIINTIQKIKDLGLEIYLANVIFNLKQTAVSMANLIKTIATNKFNNIMAIRAFHQNHLLIC